MEHSVKLNVDYLNHCLYPLVISIVCNKCLIINCENFFKRDVPVFVLSGNIKVKRESEISVINENMN